MAYITISGPPTLSQDANGWYTATISYSDGINSYAYFSGPNLPDIYQAVQAASLDLAENYNQTQLASDGLIPTVAGDSGSG